MIIYKNKKLEIPVGLGPNFNEGSEEILNQNKTVDSSTFFQRVYPDSGYTGLGRVNINPYVLDAKTVDSSTETQIVTSEKDGLYRVVVNPYHLDAVTIDSSTETQVVTGAYDEITVTPYELDEKTVDSSTVAQVVTSDVNGLSKVTVNPLVMDTLRVDSSTVAQTIEGAFNEVNVSPYVLDEKTVDSSTNPQIVHSGNDGMSQVTVNPYTLDEKTVDSSTNSQEITSDADGLSKVTISPYVLDEKTVDSSTNPQVITSDEDGLSQVTIRPYVLSPLEVDSSTASQEITGQFGTVTVNPYTLDSSSAVITENGDYAFESSADGLSRVDVSVNIDTQSYYDEGYSDGETVGIAEGIAEQKAKLDSSVFTTNGTYTREDGWNEIEVAVPGINNQNKTADSSTVQQTVTFDSGYSGLGTVTINPYFLQNKNSGVSYKYMNSDSNPGSFNVTPDAGYNGLGQVTVPYAGILSSKIFTPTTSQQSWDAYNDTDELVGLRTVIINAVTSSIDSNIAAGNIKKDVTILGVTGTFDGGTLQSKSVDSSTRSQTIVPSSGYYGLSSVVVNPYELDSKTANSSTNIQTITSSKDGLSSVTINPYILDSKTVDASTSQVVVTSSADGLSSVTVNAVTSSIDSNIQAGNIKKDVVILGVTGTYEGGSEPTPLPVEYISNEGDLNLVFNSGYIPNDNTKIIARIAWGGEGLGSWGNYFGVQNNFALREWGGYGSQSGEITWQTIGRTCAVQNVYTTPGDITIVRDIEVGNNYVNADSSSGSTGQYSGWISDYPMFIFGACDPGNGTLTELSSREMRIHSFAIYEGTTLIKNLVPFQDASLNGCFYDTVSDTYIYPLQGTPTVGPVAIYQQKVVDASLNAIEVTADAGFEALSKVTVNGVTSAVDPNIVPSNIKAGVNILGVGGSFAGAIYHRIGYVANNSTNKKIFRNTGIIPTTNTRIEATISFDDIATGEGGYGYFWGTTSGASFVVREFGGYGSRNVSFFDPSVGYYSSDMSSAPRTYSCGQVENNYAFMSYGGYIDKRTTWSYTWSTGDEIFIWAANKGNDTVDEYASRVMRVYDFKIYEGDTLVFHGVPAADNDGNAILLDLVSNTMVEGEGTLTGGGVYAEADEDNYIENGEYDGNRQAGTLFIVLPNTTTLHNLSDNTNVKYFFEITLSTPENVSGAANTAWFYGRYNGASQAIGLYLQGKSSGSPTIAGYAGEGPLNPTDAGSGKSPRGVHKYTSVAYYNNNPTYYGGKLCIYVDGVPQLIRGITTGNSPVDGQVRLFTCNATGASGLRQTYLVKGTRIYMIRYYSVADNEVHVLVPAYNNNQYCLHDLTSNTYLYVNSGTLTGHVTDRFLANNGAINVYTP